jgi:hypothetical protein
MNELRRFFKRSPILGTVGSNFGIGKIGLHSFSSRTEVKNCSRA